MDLKALCAGLMLCVCSAWQRFMLCQCRKSLRSCWRCCYREIASPKALDNKHALFAAFALLLTPG